MGSMMRRRLSKLRKDEQGQTQTEYLMIVGLMAAVIIAVFVTIFWPQVKTATNQLLDKITGAVSGGSGIQ